MGVDIKRYICSGLFGATVLVPNRNEPRSEGLATAGLPNVNDCDPRVLAEPSIDLVLEGAGILIAVHHRSVLPEELHLHQKTPLPPNVAFSCRGGGGDSEPRKTSRAPPVSCNAWFGPSD